MVNERPITKVTEKSGKKTSALKKARSQLKKTDRASTPLAVKRKIMKKEKKT